MGTYVYIALEGLRKSPISEEAWLSAVQQCDELVVDKRRLLGPHRQCVVCLKKDRQARVQLDRYGIAGARDPSKELIAVMFKIASFLEANVYSERFNKYTSADDWMRRRTSHRRTFDKQRAYNETQHILHFTLWCILCAASALFGFALGSLYLALRS